MDINVDLFRRLAPKKKLEIIDKLEPSELLKVSPATFERIIKEAGCGAWSEKRSRNKRLRIRPSLQEGNNWNSTIDDISIHKGKLWIGVYLQYDNTGTYDEITAESFFRNGETRVEIQGDDRYGNPRTYYATYREYDKSEVVRSILKEYIYTKYKDKLEEITK